MQAHLYFFRHSCYMVELNRPTALLGLNRPIALSRPKQMLATPESKMLLIPTFAILDEGNSITYSAFIYGGFMLIARSRPLNGD